MIVPLALMFGTGLSLLFLGGKKKGSAQPQVEVEESDPELEQAALTAEPDEVPVRDDATGEVVLVNPGEEDGIPLEEVFPVETLEEVELPPMIVDVDEVEDVEAPAVEESDPELEQAALTAEPGEVPVRDDATGEVVLVNPGESETVSVDVVETARPDSLALLSLLLDAERHADWKTRHREEVAQWQHAMGLKDDGMFGPYSALAMARETGKAPIVRYWDAGWRDGPVQKAYVSDLRATGAYAGREKGQGYAPVMQIKELMS